MKFLAICVLLAVVAATPTRVCAAPSYGYVSPVILPKVHLASPDVTVVKQPYVIQQTEPVYRQVYYAADPLPAVPYVSHHHVATAAYHPSPAVYHAHAINYVV